MEKKLVRSFVIVIVLSFLSLLLAGQKVQAGPDPVQIKPSKVPAEQIKKSKPSEVLPDLVVDSIWLDNQCNINFKLKNAAQGDIPEGGRKESAVRVQFGSEIKDFPLPKVDSNGILKKAGGLVSFNTQISLKSTADVKVIVDFNRKIKETEIGERNNEKVVRLTPQCPSVAKIDLKTKTLTHEGATSQMSDVPLQKSKPLIGTPPGKGSIQADTAPLNITILSPTKNSSWNIGSNLNIQWKGILSPGNFHIHLKTPGMADTLPSGTGEPVAATIVSYTKMQPNQQGVFNYDWKIPTSIKAQDYIVKIIYADDPKVFSKSEVFKIKQGGPSIITPKPLYSGPPVKGFTVEMPLSDQKWQAGKSEYIYWQILNTIFTDQNSLDQMDEKVRIVLKDMGGAERLTIAQNVVNRKWVDWQNWKWTIPEGFPDGKYIVRVETSDGHFYGESSPVTIWNPKVAKMGKIDKLASSGQQNILKGKTPPPPVTGTFKLLSMTPVVNAQTKLLDRVDLTAEINASSDFQFVGEGVPLDPMVRPVSVRPKVFLSLKQILVKISSQVPSVSGSPLNIGKSIFRMDWMSRHCGDFAFPCPTGIFKKGKNLVKFTIYVHAINQSEMSSDFPDKSWWGPLTVKYSWESGYFETLKTKKQLVVVTKDLDLRVEVSLFFLDEIGGFPFGNGTPNYMEAVVNQPRGEKYLQSDAVPSALQW